NVFIPARRFWYATSHAGSTVTDFLDYQLMLDRWKRDLVTEFEKYIEIKNKYESRLPRELLLKSDLSSIQAIKEIKRELYESYSKSFNGLSHRMIDNLVNGTIAEWILQCPIDF
ncbi:hypothetical protein K2X92_06155, partial [Candidatus Gracilibacteria bacterium]|nr:hypothetical protein [Candidatus Gracilibacteria bacterium]